MTTSQHIKNEIIYWGLGTPVVMLIGASIYFLCSLITIEYLVTILLMMMAVCAGIAFCKIFLFLYNLWEDAAAERDIRNVIERNQNP